MVIALLTSIVNASNHAKYVSLSNQECEIKPTLINLLTGTGRNHCAIKLIFGGLSDFNLI